MHLHCLDNNNAIVPRRGRRVYHHFPIEFRNIITLQQSNILPESILFDTKKKTPKQDKECLQSSSSPGSHGPRYIRSVRNLIMRTMNWCFLCQQLITNRLPIALQWLVLTTPLQVHHHSTQDRRGFFIVESLDNNNTLTSYQLLHRHIHIAQDRFLPPTLPFPSLSWVGQYFCANLIHFRIVWVEWNSAGGWG